MRCSVALMMMSVLSASASAQVIEDWSSGSDANWFRVDFLMNPPGPLPLGGSSFTVSGGEYTMASNQPLPPLPTALGAASLYLPSLVSPDFSDGVIRTVARANNGDTDLFVLARGNLASGGYYNLAFGTGGAGTALNINRIADFVNPTLLANATIPALVAGQDYNVEFSFIGTMLSGKVWAVGSPEPAAPQVSVVDAAYPAGSIGVAVAVPLNTPGAISGTYGAVTFIPGPGTGAVLALGGLGMARRRR